MTLKTTTLSYDGKLNRNRVRLCGAVKTAPVFDHETSKHGIKYYRMVVSTIRPSGLVDEVPCMISDKDFDISQLTESTKVLIHGQFRSYNQKTEVQNKSKLLLFVYCLDVSILTNQEFAVLGFQNNSNNITLMGYLCKPPIYRKTPAGKEITDIIVVSNRANRKMDHIPCLVWGNNARYVSNFSVGDFVVIEGRIQSREYDKKDSDGNILETRTAYEVSASRIYKAGVAMRK